MLSRKRIYARVVVSLTIGEQDMLIQAILKVEERMPQEIIGVLSISFDRDNNFAGIYPFHMRFVKNFPQTLSDGVYNIDIMNVQQDKHQTTSQTALHLTQNDFYDKGSAFVGGQRVVAESFFQTCGLLLEEPESFVAFCAGDAPCSQEDVYNIINASQSGVRLH